MSGQGHWRRLVIVSAATVVLGAGMSAPALAASPITEQHRDSAVSRGEPGSPDGEVVRGLILRLAPQATAKGLAGQVRRALKSAGIEGQVGQARPITDRLVAFSVTPGLSDAEAQRVSALIARNSRVLWVDADRLVPLAPPSPGGSQPPDPVEGRALPRDLTQFPDQWYLGACEETTKCGVNLEPVHDEGIMGEGAVVAVIDTGTTALPNYRDQLLPGYDFISESWRARDGNGRDPNPFDEGDGVSQAQYDAAPSDYACLLDDSTQAPRLSTSTWHGDGVTSLIVGQGTRGIQGIAPLAKVVPVRALGICGGLTSDIVAAITWASGGSVPGVPANANPADIINLSLGSEEPCKPAAAVAIAEARSRGALPVVAAGNEGKAVSVSQGWGCRGALVVGAVSERGFLTNYTNFGDDTFPLAIMAPGGQKYSSTDGWQIRVDRNTSDYLAFTGQGTTGLTTGTSFAAPIVSAAAALVVGDRGAGGQSTSPAVVEFIVKQAGDRNSRETPSNHLPRACDAVKCGFGTIQLPELFAEVRNAEQSVATPEALAPPRVGKWKTKWRKGVKQYAVSLSWLVPKDAYRDCDAVWSVAAGKTSSNSVMSLRPNVNCKKWYRPRISTVFRALPGEEYVVSLRYSPGGYSPGGEQWGPSPYSLVTLKAPGVAANPVSRAASSNALNR